ncbi:hypothetical protein cyc_05260 [Cyclospora cayetanensis]|uniref:Uncharacterized protein n=1 Tax=Cyclospora cayetanensis TaxID=88456 RepID=A0A1D3CRJ1_9EIME|nr:hypothetical protein cyc_05260 [Cyclospora cayetanensis]
MATAIWMLVPVRTPFSGLLPERRGRCSSIEHVNQIRGCLVQELTETALALDEKRRALRWCYEEIETQRYAIESRAAAAAAEAETAAEEARNARMLQQQGLQAKEALQQLHRKTKDVHTTRH